MNGTVEEGGPWFIQGPAQGIDKGFDYALSNYFHQTDWFIRHRDRALTELGAIIVGELTLLHQIPRSASIFAVIVIFSTLGLVSVILGLSGILSCRRSYRASLECLAMVNKALWAMGLRDRISVDMTQGMKADNAPYINDPSFQAPRFVKDAKHLASTDELICRNLGSGVGSLKPRNNTCYLAMVSIGSVALLGAFLGVLAIVGKLAGPSLF